ncbi:uncharacterized protein METZ01_LOCUS183329, partial [marine metagenome]
VAGQMPICHVLRIDNTVPLWLVYSICYGLVAWLSEGLPIY